MLNTIIILIVNVMFWNLENFYDTHYDGISESDLEFSAMGGHHWGSRKFKTKCNAIAKTVFVIGDECHQLPDILCFAEVENRAVLQRLIWYTPLRKMDYKVVHFESPDLRGIDCGLLYRTSMMKLVRSFPKHIENFRTRDILVAQFVLNNGKDSLAVMVNHHPSKYGGEVSSGKREAVMKVLRDLSDSLETEGWTRQVAVGDFNDVPDASQFGIISSQLVNLADQLWQQGLGSIKFDGSWQLIDMAMVSPMMATNATMRICFEPFLLERDRKHSGYKPRRTYLGPRYKGGISDHLPVLLSVNF